MRVRPRLSGISWALWAAAAMLAPAGAQAATASFSSSQAYANPEIHSLSRPNDGAGPVIALGEWIALVFSQPFATDKKDTVTVFTLAPPTGTARFSVSFGVYNGGAPILTTTRTFNAGKSETVKNLFQQGCSAFGGCNFILITTDRVNKGASGAAVDYVSVNGEPVVAVSPTPEPSTWMLMMIGFAMLAARAKQLRALRRRPVLVV